MEIFLATFEAVIMLLGFGTIGFAIIAQRMVPQNILKVISPLVLDIALPCLVFTNIVLRFNPAELPDWWTLPLWWAAYILIVGGISFAYLFSSRDKFRSEQAMCLTYPNAIFFPLAIIPGLFGSGTPLLTELFIFTLLFPVAFFNTYHFFYFKFKKSGNAKLRNIFNPVLVATILALVLKLTGLSVYVPDVIPKITQKVGAMSLPLIMIMIGGNIYIDFRNQGNLFVKPILKYLSLKHLLYPGIVFIFLLITRPPVNVSFLLFLQSTLPPVTAVSLLVERANGDVQATNQFLIASFFVSLITVPISLTIYGLYFKLPL